MSCVENVVPWICSDCSEVTSVYGSVMECRDEVINLVCESEGKRRFCRVVALDLGVTLMFCDCDVVDGSGAVCACGSDWYRVRVASEC